ncbi:Uncharacterised protein [Salmonella enterica subsp. enterica]|uniref:Uncharacterized protein n=1 Tax=Salmonella enterica I TaxID=59201 RepID=A0A3S5DMJ7_SALET|nr:Uncharacterised protein [Salmonella enterica subsp. enterica]
MRIPVGADDLFLCLGKALRYVCARSRRRFRAMMWVVIIVGLACMAAITVMLIKTILDRREVNLIPDVSQALAWLEKTSSGVKGDTARV